MCKVTVICVAYNHAPFIAQALEGFVMQETSFPFEVLVHDDASTDGTAEIIRDYSARYPTLIKPVYQSENQYSKGVKIHRDILFPLIRGEYVALCEGDDCWIDRHKLAREVAALEAHPEADICAHAALMQRFGRRGYGIIAPAIRERVIPVEDVIIGSGGYVATCSLMVRTSVYLHPAPFREVLYNDYSLQIQGALRGGMVWLPQCMALYRYHVPGSWSSHHHGAQRIVHHERDRAMLRAFDVWSGGRYAESVALRCALCERTFAPSLLMYKCRRFLRRLWIRMYYSLARIPQMRSISSGSKPA